MTRSASAPGSIRPASCHPRLAWFVAPRSSSAAVKWPRRSVFSRRFSSTARASSKRSMTAWLSLPRLRLRAGVADAVGEVALGRRAHADRRLAQQVAVLLRQVGGMDGGGVRAERAVLGEQADRREAVRREARLVLRALLGDVEVQRLALGPLDDDVQLPGGHGPDRVDRGADLRAFDLVDALDPAERVTVAEARLRAAGRLAEATGDITRVEQRQPDADLLRRRDQRLAVVHVVELAHAGDPGLDHLGVGALGQLERVVGRDPARQRVHVLPPRPEAAAAPLRAPAQRSLERVRVRVGEAGQRDAAQPHRAIAFDAGRDRDDALTGDLDPHVGGDLVAPEPCEIRVVGDARPTRRAVGRGACVTGRVRFAVCLAGRPLASRHGPCHSPSAIGTRTPRSAATSDARS